MSIVKIEKKLNKREANTIKRAMDSSAARTIKMQSDL